MIGDKRLRAITLRDEEGKQWKEIDQILGTGKGYSRMLYESGKHRLERFPRGLIGLSTPARSSCLGPGWCCDRYLRGMDTREKVMAAILDGTLYPGNKKIFRYGWKIHNEILKWLGLPPVIKETRLTQQEQLEKMQQDLATIREIAEGGGTAADILKFLNKPLT